MRQRLSTMPKTLRALLVILLAVLLLGGCSLRFAYGKLDWLVPWYVRDFVTLDAGQRSDLYRRLAVQLTWHCRTQLADYAAGLRDAQTLFSSDRVDAAQLEVFLRRGEAWWRAVLGALMPDAGALLAGLSPAQVDELDVSLQRRMADARRDYLSGSEAEQHAARVKRMQKRLHRWLGALSPQQRGRVEAWSRALLPTTETWLLDRERRQSALVDVLRTGADAAALSSHIRPLLLPDEARMPPAHRERQARNRALTLQLLADLFNEADMGQRRRLLGEVDALASQFESMACTEPVRVSGAGSP